MVTIRQARLVQPPTGKQPETIPPLVDVAAAKLVLGRAIAYGWTAGDAGSKGWRLSHAGEQIHVLCTAGLYDGVGWTHASMSIARGRDASRLPSYEHLCALKRACFGDERFAYQVFAPASSHYSFAEVLHLWGCHEPGDGRVLPDFAKYGGI